MLEKVKRLYHCEKGATSIEYALVASLIFFVVIGSVESLGGSVKTDLYEKIDNSL